MTPEEKHAADVQRVSAAFNALPTAAQRLVDKYRLTIEAAGRLGPRGDSFAAYAQFIRDVGEAFAGTPEKIAGVVSHGSGV